MTKYSEIKLTDDERKLLEVLKDNDFTEIKKVKGHILGRRPYNYYYFNWCFWFRWMDDGDEYDIDKLLNPSHEPKTVWELENGDKYWYLDSFGSYSYSDWSDCVSRINQRNQGNVFLTKEEAEFEAKRREVVAKVRKYTRPFKNNCENWYPYWNCNSYLIGCCLDKEFKSAMDYFESNAQIESAINEVGEDDFKKYYLGVVE